MIGKGVACYIDAGQTFWRYTPWGAFLNCLGFSSTVFCRTFNLLPERARLWIMLNGAAPENQHTFPEVPYLRNVTFHSLDHDGS